MYNSFCAIIRLPQQHTVKCDDIQVSLMTEQEGCDTHDTHTHDTHTHTTHTTIKNFIKTRTRITVLLILQVRVRELLTFQFDTGSQKSTL